MDEAGHAVVADGKPVYVGDDGKDIAFDAAGTVATISRLNAEAKGHREGREAAEKALKGFDGIADPAAAIKALATVKNLDDKKLIDAGEVEKVKSELVKAYDEKLAVEKRRGDDNEQSLYSEMIGGAFARSKFIADKIAVPADLIQAQFGQRFKIEGGKRVAYDASGNKVYSRSKPGEPADFEEAIEILVDAYPHRDSILKGANGGGGGTKQSQGGAGNKTITRAAFQSLSPSAQASAITVDKMTVID